MTVSSKVENYISLKKQSLSEDLLKKFGYIEEMYNKKLWHQLTVALVSLVQEPEMKKDTELIDLYQNLICELENKINSLSLIEMAGEVMAQYSDANEAITFIEKLTPKVADNVEAKVLCNVLIAQALLHKLNDQPRTKKILEETEKLLEEIDGVTPVHGKFYLLASELHRLEGSHAEYYRFALRYFGCTDYSLLDLETRQKHAFCLGLAALLGDGIYNFGELLAHPVLEVLRGTPEEWLIDVLYTFNTGNIADFEVMRDKWSSQADLTKKESDLREKIRLLCLMEMTFKRKAWDRQLTFAEIANETGLPEDKIEVMVMRALSLGLVKGTIDQVSQRVNITWVQPRVLDKKQLASMMDRLNDWCKDVNGMQRLLEEQASTILTL